MNYENEKNFTKNNEINGNISKKVEKNNETNEEIQENFNNFIPKTKEINNDVYQSISYELITNFEKYSNLINNSLFIEYIKKIEPSFDIENIENINSNLDKKLKDYFKNKNNTNIINEIEKFLKQNSVEASLLRYIMGFFSENILSYNNYKDIKLKIPNEEQKDTIYKYKELRLLKNSDLSDHFNIIEKIINKKYNKKYQEIIDNIIINTIHNKKNINIEKHIPMYEEFIKTIKKLPNYNELLNTKYCEKTGIPKEYTFYAKRKIINGEKKENINIICNGYREYEKETNKNEQQPYFPMQTNGIFVIGEKNGEKYIIYDNELSKDIFFEDKYNIRISGQGEIKINQENINITNSKNSSINEYELKSIFQNMFKNQ